MKKQTFWIIILFLLLTGVCYSGKIFNDRINELEAKEDVTKESSYKYLAIGNSITKNAQTSFWWDSVGMAATTKENDYVHQFVKGLRKKYNNVEYDVYNFSVWERLYDNREATLPFLEEFVSSDLNLITIQLGENITNMDTMEEDFVYLVGYLQGKAPKAKIIILGNYWKNNELDEIKEKVANNYGITYVDLKEIQDKEEYTSKVGTIVYDENSKEHEIDSDGVASHPNDKAMKYISNELLKKLK